MDVAPWTPDNAVALTPTPRTRARKPQLARVLSGFMPTIPIESTADPRIAEYVGVREAELRKERFDAPGGLFVAEGELVFRRLLASPYRTRSVLTTQARLHSISDALAALPGDVPVYIVDQPTMNGIVGFNIHRGLLAIGERGPEPSLEEMLATARMVVVLEDLVNHDNLGGIFRNVAGLAGGCTGETAVLLSPKCADPLYRKAIRVSMGAALLVPFRRLSHWPDDFDALRQAGYRVAALTSGGGAVDLAAFEGGCRESPGKLALLLGSEGPGLTAGATAKSDICIRIEMPHRVATPASRLNWTSENGPGGVEDEAGIDSLNVSVACAIALHRLFGVSRMAPEPSHDGAAGNCSASGQICNPVSGWCNEWGE